MIHVLWTHRARIRLAEIHQKIAEDQPINADRFLERLIERGESLASHSFRGRMVPEFENQTIREVFEGNYRIIYQTQEQGVVILTVRSFFELLPADPKDV